MMQENSLSFLILELYHPEVDDKCIENVLNVYFMQIYEVNSERNCREFWVSWRFFSGIKFRKVLFTAGENSQRKLVRFTNVIYCV